MVAVVYTRKMTNIFKRGSTFSAQRKVRSLSTAAGRSVTVIIIRGGGGGNRVGDEKDF